MQLWIWSGIRFELPEDWEMLEFSKREDAGRCAFADRYRFRFALQWKRVPGPPDYRRMLSDYESRLLVDGAEKIKRRQVGGWHGLESADPDGGTISRFGRYFAPHGRLLEADFFWAGGFDEALADRVLRRVREEKRVTEENPRRWRAWGVDLLADPALELTECKVEPANVEFTFAHMDRVERERFGRRGLVRHWLHDNDVEAWLRKRLPERARRAPAMARAVDGHAVVRLDFSVRRRGLKALIGARVYHSAEAWICPDDGRVYDVWVSRIAPPTEETLAGTRLGCCAGVALAS